MAKPIALFKVRKREQQIENPSGYFVQALKGNWAGKKMAVANSSTEENKVDT
ncbi:hypothetical protein [Pleurocapsa sp. PCC 7319]|uniref:hypothetical protein n=1 Tax=Pleurocapsa sp. PCC 7319 TaxID=118161 RepID=UPI00034A50FF|nr:hypothetical protein [Pleurocapsa sp. PCC 7319]